jgi:hypothetical protein
MERLTKYLASGAADYNYPAGCYSGNDCNDRVAKSAYRQTCVERLAACEDTGLTPERCAEFARADAEGRYIVMRDAEQEGDARLRELAEADKDGRLVVLPCKVGDTVYRLFVGNPDNPVIATLKINTVTEAVKLIGKMGMHKYIGTFLTREEAEAALEAMKDG